MVGQNLPVLALLINFSNICIDVCKTVAYKKMVLWWFPFATFTDDENLLQTNFVPLFRYYDARSGSVSRIKFWVFTDCFFKMDV